MGGHEKRISIHYIALLAGGVAPACQSQGEEFICTTADDDSTTATCDLDRCPLQGESEAPEMKPQATGWSMSSDLDLMDFLSLKCGVHSKRKYAIFFSSQHRIMIFVTKMGGGVG